jgi:hypothetical protein
MSDQGVTYAAFVDEQLRQEQELREKLDSRAIGVVTTSSAFVAILAASAAFVAGKDFKLSHSVSTWLIVIAFLLLSGAGLSSLWANRARNYLVPSVGDLNLLLGASHWKGTEVTARSTVSLIKVDLIDSLRDVNEQKARRLQSALLVQVLGLLTVTVAILIELLSRL